MPLHIDHVDTTLEVVDDSPAATATATSSVAARGDRRALREVLRPLVIEILDDEITRYLRSQR